MLSGYLRVYSSKYLLVAAASPVKYSSDAAVLTSNRIDIKTKKNIIVGRKVGINSSASSIIEKDKAGPEIAIQNPMHP